MAHRATVQRVALAAIALAALGGCTWREGRTVVLPEDPEPDADADADGDGIAAISAFDLYGLIEQGLDLVIHDVRSREQCENGRVPGALCNPWDGSALEQDIAASDEDGWLVVYDQNGEVIQQVLDTLPAFEHRAVSYLDPGFGDWALNEELPMEQGAQ